MGKKKLSSNIEDRRKQRSNTIPLASRNRFEVHINRSKHKIVGQKQKNDRGIPGISRSKANKKRKETLLVKYKQRNKSNVMIDKRFGEFDETVSAEEKMLKRFTLEKQSHHVKTGHYNLEDDEELTHYGQNLGDISNFDDIQFGSDDDAYDGNDDGGFGGLLTKKRSSSDNLDDKSRNLTRKEIMQEMIVNSKRDKHERQKTKELAFELTQKLDTEWKQIHSMLTKRSDSKTVIKEKQDDYDKIVNELLFEAKGKPTERLKSVEEIANEEKRWQAVLERQRLERMEMGDEDESESVHQSADALIEKLPKKVDDRFMVQYKDGEMVKPEGFDDALTFQAGVSSENDDHDEDEDDGQSEGEGTDEDGEDTDDEDVFSDEENEEESGQCSDEEEETTNDEVETVLNESEIVGTEAKDLKILENSKSNENADIKRKKKKSKKDKVKSSEVDNTKCLYEVPDNIESFLCSKLDGTVYFPKARLLNIGNKKKLGKLFDLLLEYIDHICSNPAPAMNDINRLGGFIQQLGQDIPGHVAKSVKLKLKLFLDRICTCIKERQYFEILPSLSELTLLGIIELLFPTSDLKHDITTPSLFMIALILTKARFDSVKCIISGILLLDIVYNYVKLSKRYLPEMVTFLVRLFNQAIPTKLPLKKITSSVLNMENRQSGMLYVSDKNSSEPCTIDISAVLSSSCEVSSLENDSMKLSAIRNMLLLTEKICNLYKDMETFNEIFEPMLFLLEKLPVENYPLSLCDTHCNVLNLMQSKSVIEKAPLKLQTRKPIPLTLLEPQFEEVNDNLFKKRTGDKSKNEHDKLKYKVKKEMKGALREIRKDTQYLAKQQLNERLEKDATRKRKVKELKSALENEQREIKELEKGSKVKK